MIFWTPSSKNARILDVSINYLRSLILITYVLFKVTYAEQHPKTLLCSLATIQQLSTMYSIFIRSISKMIVFVLIDISKLPP